MKPASGWRHLKNEKNLVYGFRCKTTGRVKVGYSRHATKRFLQVSGECPTDLHLEIVARDSTYEDESSVHKALRVHRLHAEWFDVGGRNLLKTFTELFSKERLERIRLRNPNNPEPLNELAHPRDLKRLEGSARNLRRKGYVYLVQCQVTGLIKIGCSSNPDRRIKGLAANAPGELRLVCQVDGVEAEFHEQFASYRHHGEWFSVPGGRLVQFILDNHPQDLKGPVGVLVRPPRHRELADIDFDWVGRQLDSGKTLVQVARTLGRSPRTLGFMYRRSRRQS